MAAFGSSGIGQFGSESSYLDGKDGAGLGGALAGMLVQKSGLESFLNNQGLSFKDNKLGLMQSKPIAGAVVPESSSVPVAINPANPNDQVAQSTPVMPYKSTSVTELGKLSDFNNYDSGIGHGVLDIGMKLMGL